MFDTTGVGYFPPGKKVPDPDTRNERLKKQRMAKVKVTKVAEVELPKAVAAFQVTIAELGCMSTAIETRDVSSKLDGVIRVHPNGRNGKCLVIVKDKKALTEEIVAKALKGTAKLRLRKFESVPL